MYIHCIHITQELSVVKLSSLICIHVLCHYTCMWMFIPVSQKCPRCCSLTNKYYGCVHTAITSSLLGRLEQGRQPCWTVYIPHVYICQGCNVADTASTGIVTTQFDDDTMTLLAWAGVKVCISIKFATVSLSLCVRARACAIACACFISFLYRYKTVFLQWLLHCSFMI